MDKVHIFVRIKIIICFAFLSYFNKVDDYNRPYMQLAMLMLWKLSFRCVPLFRNCISSTNLMYRQKSAPMAQN